MIELTISLWLAFAPQIVTSGGNLTLGGNVKALPSAAQAAITQTDCSTLSAEIWDATGYEATPLGDTAAETQDGDGCDTFEVQTPTRE